MSSTPSKNKILTFYRKYLNIIEKYLPKVEVEPSLISILGVVINIIFLYFINSFPLNVVILFVALAFDFLDGAFARILNKSSREGYLLDVFFDRLTEGLIFIVVIGSIAGKIFFILFMINILLNFYSIKTNKHLSIPLRFSYMVYLFFV